MGTNTEMTPQRSLELINETLEANRKAIIAGSGKYLIMWGCLLCVFSLAVLAFPMNITLVIILLFGFAETVSGIALKNWPIMIAGVIVGIGGACAAVSLAPDAEQILLFTGAAVVLALTGVAIQLRK